MGKMKRVLNDADMRKAIDKGQFSRVRSILEEGHEIDRAFTTDTLLHRECLGKTPLMWAAIQNKPKIVRLLLERGAQIEAKDRAGQTVLHHVVAEENLKMCRLLLGVGASVNAATIGADTPMHIAVNRDNTELCQLLIDFGARSSYVVPDLEGVRSQTYLTPFQEALNDGNKRVVEYLVKHGGEDLQQKTVDGRSLDELLKGKPKLLEFLRVLRTEQAIASAMSEDAVTDRGNRKDKMMGML